MIEPLLVQVEHARARVPWWSARLAHIDLASHSDAWRRLPVSTTDAVRALGPWDLVAQPGDVCFGRATSGTTGPPVPVWWTRDDLRLLFDTVAGGLRGHCPPSAHVAYVGYHGSHLAASIYEAALQRLGLGTFLRPPTLHHDAARSASQFVALKGDTLVLAQPSGEKFGAGMTAWLELAAQALGAVRWWVSSSTPLDPTVVERARGAGISSITNLYGASEFGHFAVSEAEDPGVHRLLRGHVCVEILRPDGEPAAIGQRGRVVVSRIAMPAPNGGWQPQGGSQFLRLDLGDEATVVGEEDGWPTHVRDIARAARDGPRG